MAELLTSFLCVEGQRGTYSCVASPKQLELTQLIPLQVKPKLMSNKLMVRFGHGNVAVGSIGGTLHHRH